MCTYTHACACVCPSAHDECVTGNVFASTTGRAVSAIDRVGRSPAAGSSAEITGA